MLHKSWCELWCIDAKSVLTFENHPLMAELEFKMSQAGQLFMFSISAVPPVFKCQSYSNLRNVCMFVCVLTPPWFIDLRAPNLAGRSGAGTKNTSRKQNFKILNGCHGNQKILSRPRYWTDRAEFVMV